MLGAKFLVLMLSLHRYLHTTFLLKTGVCIPPTPQPLSAVPRVWQKACLCLSFAVISRHQSLTKGLTMKRISSAPQKDSSVGRQLCTTRLITGDVCWAVLLARPTPSQTLFVRLVPPALPLFPKLSHRTLLSQWKCEFAVRACKQSDLRDLLC